MSEPIATTASFQRDFRARIKLFFTFLDARFEDLDRKTWKETLYRDFSAGLVVALTAIPMAMGFAIAMGLRPEQGIIAGALACIVGRTFGGSKYQVYGPTAAFIPLIASVMHEYGPNGGGTFAQGHGMLVLVSCCAGVVLMLSGLLGLGKLAQYVPNSIVVGFTVGIAATIALSNAGEAVGVAAGGGNLLRKLSTIAGNMHNANYWALGIALLTFALTKILLRISIYLPAPLIALGVSTGLAATVFKGKGIKLVSDQFGAIPTNFFVFTPPQVPTMTAEVVGDVVYFTFAIVFVSAVESLLCSSMADRLANNTKTPFNPDKELWGQGLVQIITPLVNGFPCTGALARTATSIKAGAKTPLAGYFKGVLKLAIAYFLAPQLGYVPMACIAGILLWVATNMVKMGEIREVREHGTFHTVLMTYTAVAVPMTDFLTGVLSALVIYGVFRLVYGDPSLVKKAPEQRVIVRGGLTFGKGTAAAMEGLPEARAVLGADMAMARHFSHAPALPAHHGWLRHIRANAMKARTAFVHRDATLIGHVVLGDHVHIAAGSSVRADEGTPFFIGADSNIQDGVVIHALKEKHVLVEGEPWAVYIGKNVSVAHDALVHGPCYIGDDTFIGFKAIVHDSVVGKGCFIGHGAIVVGVEVPEGRMVPSGQIIDTLEAALALPKAGAAQRHFNEDVVDVNRGLAAAYRAHGREKDVATTARMPLGAEPEPRLAMPWEEAWESTRGQF
jgi:MFS superfamily sulfate permease-like transporter/carbonic anhydrase/acetyltransferase-like protein (isoleucine patch superfamily)